jgi:hypothetical protein
MLTFDYFTLYNKTGDSSHRPTATGEEQLIRVVPFVNLTHITEM